MHLKIVLLFFSPLHLLWFFTYPPLRSVKEQTIVGKFKKNPRTYKNICELIKTLQLSTSPSPL